MSRAEALKAKQFDEAEWKKMYYKHQKQYIRRRLEAIKHLQEGKSRKEVMEKVGCARQSLTTWIDMALLETWWRCCIKFAEILAQTGVDTASFLCCHHKSRRASRIIFRESVSILPIV